MQMSVRKIDWVEIDEIGLCHALAEYAWIEDTKSVTSDKLYTLIVKNDGSIDREVSHEWAVEFYKLVDKYGELVKEYRR